MSTPDAHRYPFGRSEMPVVEGPHAPIVRYHRCYSVERCGDEEIDDEGMKKSQSNYQLCLRNHSSR